MAETYIQTREKLEGYFDRTAAKTWERLTSDAPVSRIRQTVRAGRDAMRQTLLDRLPADLSGARVLDAGCGAGPMSIELAKRGADVLGLDISPSLLTVAEKRTPEHLLPQITYLAGDMLDASHGQFDYIIAMDSLIHYRPIDIANALSQMLPRTQEAIVFTVAPKTMLLSAMHMAGKAFPRSDRSPAIVPIGTKRLASELGKTGVSNRLTELSRINSGFYISQAMEVRG